MQSTQALEARIEGLERQVRSGRRWTLGLGGILACLGLQALAGPRQSTEVPEVITARMFKVVDKSGRLRATLGPDHTGPNTNSLCLWDPVSETGSNVVLQIAAKNGGAEIWMHGGPDVGAVEITTIGREQGAAMRLYSSCIDEVHPRGSPKHSVLQLTAGPDGGALGLTTFETVVVDEEHMHGGETYFLRSPKESIDRRPR